MTLLGELKFRARHIIGPVLAATLFAYFAYHAVQGDRGLIAWIKLSQQVSELNLEHDKISARRGALAIRVKRLQPESLDADLLEERTRVMLGYVHDDDMVIGAGRGGFRFDGLADPISTGAAPRSGQSRSVRGPMVHISLLQ
ncbi:MAG: cell division protein FtsB [Alphaproteobacteria bacterium]|jgi:cell division protein FtsB